ncbi:hypothetical protein HGRIS_008923 [Hohenbuehelia grisea]|uniref:Heme haloperoxidase family profile domain-containing protein n=1 Tax=Hohenbuehelia grisea TaxID=104357 RepID=A0ABR3IZX6_9AGAR
MFVVSRLVLLSTAVLVAAGVVAVSQSLNAQSAFQAPVNDEHPFVRPKAGDDRSPCPALNTLANHGYLPHNGRGISHSQLFNSLREGFGLSHTLATLLTFGSYTLLRQAPPLSLLDISRHGGVEHNCSLAHRDIMQVDYEYPPMNLDSCLMQKLVAESQDGEFLDVEDVARARVRRESAPEYKNAPLDALHAEIARGEMSLVLGIFGDGKRISLDVLKDWFENERFPEGWKPEGPQGFFKTFTTARKIRDEMNRIRKQG